MNSLTVILEARALMERLWDMAGTGVAFRYVFSDLCVLVLCSLSALGLFALALAVALEDRRMAADVSITTAVGLVCLWDHELGDDPLEKEARKYIQDDGAQ